MEGPLDCICYVYLVGCIYQVCLNVHVYMYMYMPVVHYVCVPLEVSLVYIFTFLL